MKEKLNILLEGQTGDLIRKAEMALSNLFRSPALQLNAVYQDNLSFELFKVNIDRYLAGIEKMKTEDIVEVPLNIGIPVLNKLVYSEDAELIELYINLLINASIINTKNMVIPVFNEMITRLSVDEARIIKYFSKIEYIPFLSIRKLIERKMGYNEFVNRLTGIEFELELNSPCDIGLYFENFSATGILYTSWGFKKTDADQYNRLIVSYKNSNPEIARIMQQDNAEDKLIRGYFNFTGLGKRFVKVTNGGEWINE